LPQLYISTTFNSHSQRIMAFEARQKAVSDIVSTVIADESSPIAAWMTNVIETYLADTQQTEPLSTETLCRLTHEMLSVYSITSNASESRAICSALMSSLESNGYFPPFLEPFPANTHCLALFADDNQWYNAKIISVTEPGQSYTIEFDGFEGSENTATVEMLRNIDCEATEPLREAVSLRESIGNTVDHKLEEMMRSDVSLRNNGVEEKKCRNAPMKLHDVDEEKLALSMMDDDDLKFAEFANATTADDENEELLDAAKYTVIDDDGKKRKIDPLNDSCALCQRLMSLTWHHLIPKSTHNDYLRAHPKATRLYLNTHGAWICRQCHSAIHGIHSNQELMKRYSTVPQLMECERVRKWIQYISKRRASKHYARGVKTQNVVALLQRKQDRSTAIKYIQ